MSEMVRLVVYCEGQSEEAFCNRVLHPFMRRFGVLVKPIVCITKATSDRIYSGGIKAFGKFSKELRLLCRQYSDSIVTTMIDYYGLPDDYPLVHCAEKDIYKKIALIEREIEQTIDAPNLIAYIALHEYEALMFSDPTAFVTLDWRAVPTLSAIKAAFEGNPELINTSRETAPSKRIKRCVRSYSKVSDGVRIAQATGIPKMLEACPHFAAWIKRILAVAKSSPRKE